MTFTSAVLGSPAPNQYHPQYLEKFRGTQKCIALILSWLTDGYKQAKAGKPPGLYCFTGTCPRVWLLPRYSSPTPQRTLWRNTPQRTL